MRRFNVDNKKRKSRRKKKKPRRKEKSISSKVEKRSGLELI